MYPGGVWTLLSWLAFASLARGQGYLGVNQTTCTSTTPWQYQGCLADASGHAGYPWQLAMQVASPQWFPGNTGRSLMTLDLCLRGCRGHGYKFASVYGPSNGQYCYCGALPYSAGTLTAFSDNTTTTASTPPNNCHLSPVANNGCVANKAQWCGRDTSSDYWLDSSFPTTTPVVTDYQYLGCFTTQEGGISAGYVTAITAADTTGCHTQCMNRGMPYSFLVGADGTTANCQCSTEIQYPNLLATEAQCTIACSPGS